MPREEQKSRSDLVRQAILDTALEIGLKEGFEEVSIRKIIHRMNYTTGVVYHHFKDKQEIIDAIEASQTEWMKSVIEELLDETKDSAYNIVRVFHRILLLALDEPEKYNLIVLHKYSRNKPGKPEWVNYLAESLRKDMQATRVREMDPYKAAFSIWSSFVGFILMISRNDQLTKDEAESMFQVQAQIILKGVLL